MVNLIVPLPYIQMFAVCVDDSLPKFKPDNWIKKNHWYNIKHFANSLNTDVMAVTITDKKGKIIKPSSTMYAFRLDRFIVKSIYLN